MTEFQKKLLTRFVTSCRAAFCLATTYGTLRGPSAMLCGARPASWSVATVRCISHASEGALCLSEPRSAAVYSIAVSIE